MSRQNFEQNKRILRALPAGRISHCSRRIYSSLIRIKQVCCVTEFHFGKGLFYKQTHALAVLLKRKCCLRLVYGRKFYYQWRIRHLITVLRPMKHVDRTCKLACKKMYRACITRCRTVNHLSPECISMS